LCFDEQWFIKLVTFTLNTKSPLNTVINLQERGQTRRDKLTLLKRKTRTERNSSPNRKENQPTSILLEDLTMSGASDIETEEFDGIPTRQEYEETHSEQPSGYTRRL
jgi:hypothetical protein